MRYLRYSHRGAVFNVRTSQERAVFDDFTSAMRTNGRLFYISAIFRMLGYSEYFGNDVVTASYEYSRTYFYIFSYNVFVIIERRLRYCDSTKIHRLDYCERIELSRSAHLPPDVFDGSRRLFRFILIRYRPTRKFFRISEIIPDFRIADFDYRPVYQKIERFAFFFDLVDSFSYLFPTRSIISIFAYLELIFAKKLYHFLLTFELFSLDVSDIIAYYVKISLRGHFWIEVPDSSCCAVPCVLERLFRLLIILFQFAKTHYSLALHFTDALKRNSKRHAFYRLHLLGNVFAFYSVASRRSFDQPSVFISQIDSQSVELVFDTALRHIPERLYNSRLPRRKLFFRLTFIKRIKSAPMSIRNELL